MPNIDQIKLIAGHAMIRGNKPDIVKPEDVVKEINPEGQNISKFGLFDNSTPNYSTYYPDVEESDLEPKDSDFINPLFRALSNTTVHANWNPIYFPVEILKASLRKLEGQSINIDHETAVGNAIGSVLEAIWQDAYKSKGIDVPAGINVQLKIDGKSNPRIARGIMMDPPSIHSVSVTVRFKWEKSHPDMGTEEFWAKLGTYDKDGNMIQRVVTEIIAFDEISLVSHGADPFAQKLDKDGKIINPLYSQGVYQFSAFNPQTDTKIKQNTHIGFIDYKTIKSDTIDNTSLSKEDHHPKNNINKHKIDNTMEELLRFLESQLGLEKESLTKENYNEALKKSLKKEPVKVLDLEGVEVIENEITELREFRDNTPENLEEIQLLAKVGENHLKNMRNETTRLYNLVVGEDNADEAMLNMIANADETSLKSLYKQYEKLSEDKFQATCQECGSHNISRASLEQGSQGDEGEKGPKDTREVSEKFLNKAGSLNLSQE